MKGYFIAGINTDSGKTIVSALLCHIFQADYFKPIQSGEPTDSNSIRKLTSAKIFAEVYKLKRAESVHSAAEKENITVELNKIQLPKSNNVIIVESAGGVLSPVNRKEFTIDLAMQIGLPVILVVNYYLGSISHTLLTIELLKKYKVEVVGLIFNGEENADSKSIILEHSPWPEIFSVAAMENVNEKKLKELADHLTGSLPPSLKG